MSGERISYSRLRWRCRRGMLELDLLLQAFLDKEFALLDEEDQQHFAHLLELPDQTLHEYLMGNSDVREKEFAHVIARIRNAVTA